MNKILRYSLMMLFAVVGMNAMAQDVTINTNSSTFTANGNDYVATSGGVTFTYSKANASTNPAQGVVAEHLRVYKNATFTISSTTKDIAKIVVTAIINNTIGANGFVADGYAAATDKSTGTWTGNSKKVDVYFADASDTRTATEITFADGYATKILNTRKN